jgi:hypothetical protein
LRKKIAEEYKIHYVVDIESGAFKNTGTKTSMLVFQKGVGPTTNVKFISLLMNEPNTIPDHEIKDLITVGIEDLQKRIPRKDIKQFTNYLKKLMKKYDIKIENAGSYRLGKKDSGDIDLIFAIKNYKNHTNYAKMELVENIVNELKDTHDYALCIAPEGTRKSVERIRSGFYYIAKELNIPVVYCGIDFSKKTITFEAPRKMGNDVNEEKKWFIEMCRKYTPLYPEHCYYTNDYYTSLKCDEDNSTYVFNQNNPLFNQKIQQNQQNHDNNSEVSSLSGNSNIMNQLDNKIKKKKSTNNDISPISYFEMENPMLKKEEDNDSYVSRIDTYE